ncbi:MAG: PilZ domain-containing protein [Roseiarcus sp.]|jgi:hypothetical protein
MNMPTDDAGAAATERRRALRTRCLREGRCVFNNDCSILNVLVRNISATGAKLTGSELICLPDEFELQVNDGNGVFVSRRVRRIWSHADAVGVAFVDSERERSLASGPTGLRSAASARAPVRGAA